MDKLYEYLLSDNILLFEDEIFEIIPELKNEKGFEQKSEWHCYDVWDHTIATINACDKNVEDRLVLLLHDIGKPFSYQDDGEVRHFKNHANKSKEISESILKRLNVPEDISNVMLNLISMHSSKINIEDINNDIDFYRRLLKIKKCDAKGYEKEHSKIIIKDIESLEKRIRIINK